MRNTDVVCRFKDKTDVSERILAEIKHRERGNDGVNGIPHSLERGFSKELCHGSL